MESPRLSECLAEYPNQVLDAVRRRLRIKSDAALSRTLGVSPSVISNIRHGKIPLRSVLIVRILDTTHLHIRDLYSMSRGTMPKKRTAKAPASEERESAD